MQKMEKKIPKVALLVLFLFIWSTVLILSNELTKCFPLFCLHMNFFCLIENKVHILIKTLKRNIQNIIQEAKGFSTCSQRLDKSPISEFFNNHAEFPNLATYTWNFYSHDCIFLNFRKKAQILKYLNIA